MHLLSVNSHNLMINDDSVLLLVHKDQKLPIYVNFIIGGLSG